MFWLVFGRLQGEALAGLMSLRERDEARAPAVLVFGV
jgi:hypothetical protein